MTTKAMGRYVAIFALFTAVMCSTGCGNSSSTPSAPTGLTVSSTVSKNTLSWNAVSGCVYNIYRGTSAGAESAIAGSYTATYVDTPPVGSTTKYYYFVTALNSDAVESAASNEVSVVSPTLTLGTVTSTSVVLNWTVPSSVTGVTGYNIYRSTTTGSEASPATATSTTASYTDTAVVTGTTYYYRVTAVGSNGETMGSNEISAAP